MSATVNLTITNNSGEDLVIAFLQGGLPGQTVDQLKWLNLTNTPTWEVPNTPKTPKDIAPYIKTIKSGKNVVITVPSYTALVGFRCLVADPAYQNDAIKSINKRNYMAFPNLMTAAYHFDKFEAGLTTGVTGIWNITSVDFLGIPMQLEKGTQKVGYKDGTTAEGMNKLLAALGNPYNNGATMTPNTATQTYRFFAPQHISSATTCLDKQIMLALPKLPTNSCTVNYGADVFSDFKSVNVTNTPSVKGTISCTSKNNGTITIDDITTSNALNGSIGTSSSNTNSSTVLLGALIAAAICRGVLANPQHWGDIVYTSSQCATPWNYYPKGQQYDAYSKVIHQYSIDGKNYGFSYDDYFADEAGFNVTQGDNVTLNILKIKGKMTATPNAKPPIKKGCLVITTSEEANIKLGTMSCNNIPLNAITNKLCFLESKVVIRFKNYPSNLTNPELHIDLSNNTTNGLSYWENSAKSTTLSIIGLSYIPEDRQLTLGDSASWHKSK